MVRAAPAPLPERGFLLGRLSNAGLTVPRAAPRQRPTSETLHHCRRSGLRGGSRDTNGDQGRVLPLIFPLGCRSLSQPRKGAILGAKFVPDISVGIHWGKFWTKENLDVIYGDRIKYEHNYPIYFPQAASNPQQPYCYPDEALGEFRKWVRDTYIPRQMPEYLNNKIRDGQIPAPAARAALDAFAPRKHIASK
jgi:hypothetical protein